MILALAEARLQLGETPQAQADADEALRIMRQRGLRYYEARALEVLALLAAERGEIDLAVHHSQQARAMEEALRRAPTRGISGADDDSQR